VVVPRGLGAAYPSGPLGLLARGGVKIRGVLDRGQAHQKWALPPWLKHENLELRVPPKPGPAGFKVRKVHYKTAVVDDRTVVAGSFNYTRPANDFNDENIFVIGSPYGEINRDGGRSRLRRRVPASSPCTSAASSSGSSRFPRSSRPRARADEPGPHNPARGKGEGERAWNEEPIRSHDERRSAQGLPYEKSAIREPCRDLILSTSCTAVQVVLESLHVSEPRNP
jgi:hypothetical protein